VSFEIIMMTSVTRPCFTTQHQTCKTKTKTDFLVSDRSCPKTDGLRPHLWLRSYRSDAYPGVTKTMVTTTISPRFDCDSTSLRPFDELRYDRKPS